VQVKRVQAVALSRQRRPRIAAKAGRSCGRIKSPHPRRRWTTLPCSVKEPVGDLKYQLKSWRMAFSQSLRAGWFNFYFAVTDGNGPEVARVHGYEPERHPRPTCVGHKHPDDHSKVDAVLDHVRRTHQTISTGTASSNQRRTREVIVLARSSATNTGAEVGTHGFSSTLTSTQLDRVEVTQLGRRRPWTNPSWTVQCMTPSYAQVVSDAVSEMAQSRGPIERSKAWLI